MNNDTKSRVICRGGAGIELSLWCGFHAGRDLFHVYLSLGVVTLYLTSTPLHDFLKRMKAGRDALRGDGR
jgi:hypothetical protein